MTAVDVHGGAVEVTPPPRSPACVIDGTASSPPAR
jgi:hypothetical protein